MPKIESQLAGMRERIRSLRAKGGESAVTVCRQTMQNAKEMIMRARGPIMMAMDDGPSSRQRS
jgi:hypothetical protein